MTNVVVTTLLTSSPDPQRNLRWTPDPAVLAPLIRSVRGAEVVVLHDEPLVRPLLGAHSVQVPPLGNPYHARWRHLDAWLAERHFVDFAFAVDGTDVQMLHQPWDHMRGFNLYVGSEKPDEPARRWLLDTHPSFGGVLPPLVYNAGICGAARGVLQLFLATLCQDLDARAADDLTDMAAFNRAATAHHALSGHPVHTRLHGMEDDHPTAWWRHK